MPTTVTGHALVDGAALTATATLTVQDGGVSGPPEAVTGVNINSPEPAYYTDWNAVRVYRQTGTNGLVASFNKTQPDIIGVTDDPNWPAGGGQATADKVRAMLEDFYYGTGSTARQNCWVNVANGNEVTNDYATGTLPASVVTTWRLMWEAVHTLNTDGTRRYPRASMGIDVTTWTVTQGTAGPRFAPVVPYLDFVAASLYPPGRAADPVVWSPYSEYVDAVLAMCIDWRGTNPALNRFAIWETGSPIDHATDAGGPNNLGPTNWTIRPRYFAGGRASNGTTYEGLLNYVWRKFHTENGFQVNELIYWNEYKTGSGIPNPWKHDRTPLATPDLVTAWHNWTPGSSLPPA